MPPKKTSNAAAGEGKFSWEGPNDNKLLLLTQGRYVKPEEYETLSSAFPGTTPGSIRNRISALRVKQRNLYEEYGWTLPEGGAGHSAKKPKKSVTDTANRTASAGPSSPASKKRRARWSDDDEMDSPSAKKTRRPAPAAGRQAKGKAGAQTGKNGDVGAAAQNVPGGLDLAVEDDGAEGDIETGAETDAAGEIEPKVKHEFHIEDLFKSDEEI